MQLQKIRNVETIAQSSEELSEDEIRHCDNSHAMVDDQRLYKGEKTQQDDKVTKCIIVSNKAQKDWPRKCFQIDENENYESTLMWWESQEGSEQESKKRKTIGRVGETNDDKENQDDKIDDEKHVQHTVYTGNRLNIPFEELKLGIHDNTLTLATQETWVKNLVYITNIQDGKLGTMKNA